jgi:hypothetical protein
MRLKSMAAVLAKIMQSRTSEKTRNEGLPCAATKSAPNANGSAKIVCEKRIKRRNRVSAFEWLVTGMSAIGIQQLLELLARGFEKRRAVRKEHSLELEVQEMSQ